MKRTSAYLPGTESSLNGALWSSVVWTFLTSPTEKAPKRLLSTGAWASALPASEKFAVEAGGASLGAALTGSGVGSGVGSSTVSSSVTSSDAADFLDPFFLANYLI